MIQVKINSAQAKKDLDAINKQFRPAFQHAIGYWMDMVRDIAAKQQLIPNRTGYLNPYRARQAQPSTSGRLTNRTGKMKYMLAYDVIGGGYGLGYSGYSMILFRKRTKFLNIMVRATDRANVESYEGTIRATIQAPDSYVFRRGNLSDPYQRMPKETPDTLAKRFNWENKDRKYMEPAALSYSMNLNNIVTARLNAIIAKFGSSNVIVT